EFLAEAGAQTGGAHALGSDDRVALEHDGRNSGASGFTGGGAPGRPAADDKEFGGFHWRAVSSYRVRRGPPKRAAAYSKTGGVPSRAKPRPVKELTPRRHLAGPVEPFFVS